MKKSLIPLFALLTAALLPCAAFSAEPEKPGTKAGDTKQTYTCPMKEHADVKMDKPGKCPKCGMTLVPQKAGQEGGGAKKS